MERILKLNENYFLTMKILRWGELVYVKQKLLVLYLSRGLKFIYFKANLLYNLHVLFTYLSLTFVINVYPYNMN